MVSCFAVLSLDAALLFASLLQLTQAIIIINKVVNSRFLFMVDVV
jgi:hypothetical protein